jgi:hypothetical protein
VGCHRGTAFGGGRILLAVDELRRPLGANAAATTGRGRVRPGEGAPGTGDGTVAGPASTGLRLEVEDDTDMWIRHVSG